MKNGIFYFTGTGNSLAVARKLAKSIGDAEVIAITTALREEKIELNYESIGLVLPVYYYSPPNMVKEFIKKLNFSKTHYVYVVCTYGGMYGGVFNVLSECIKNSGGKLNAGFSIWMSGNYIVEYGAFPVAIRKIQSGWERRRVRIIAENVLAKRNIEFPKGNFITKHYENYAHDKVKKFGAMSVNFHENGSCTGCEVCRKICPSGNILIKDRKPIWGTNCEQCMACIQWCPQKAIEYGKVTQKRKRYRHRDIILNDMMLD